MLTKPEITSLSMIAPQDLANELTLMFGSSTNRLTAMDYALFHNNEYIRVNCPKIVTVYENLNLVCSFKFLCLSFVIYLF